MKETYYREKRPECVRRGVTSPTILPNPSTSCTLATFLPPKRVGEREMWGDEGLMGKEGWTEECVAVVCWGLLVLSAIVPSTSMNVPCTKCAC